MIDADCIIAAVLTPEGATTRLLDLWQQGVFELVVCPQLIREVRKALLSPRIADRYGVARDDAEDFAASLAEDGLLTADPESPPRVVPADPNDDYLVALALVAECDLFVTRDHHFEGVQVDGLLIVDPRRALEHLSTFI